MCSHGKENNKVVAEDLEKTGLSGGWIETKVSYCYMCLSRSYIPFHLDTGSKVGNNTIIQG
jgi:hypothetical protein